MDQTSQLPFAAKPPVTKPSAPSVTPSLLSICSISCLPNLSGSSALRLTRPAVEQFVRLFRQHPCRAYRQEAGCWIRLSQYTYTGCPFGFEVRRARTQSFENTNLP